MWNKRKIAIDSMSREIRALSLQTSHGGTHGKIILEMLDMITVGAVRLFRVLQCFESIGTCKSRDEVLLRLSQYGSIKTIVRDAIAEFSLEIFSRLETELEMAFAKRKQNDLSEEMMLQSKFKGQLRNAISTSRYLNNAFDDGLLRLVRLKQGPKGSWDEHAKISTPKDKNGRAKRESCALCCSPCLVYWKTHQTNIQDYNYHIEDIIAAHDVRIGKSRRSSSRKGSRTTTICKTCSVPLCATSRAIIFGTKEESCFDAWHRLDKVALEHPLFHPSCVRHDEVSIEESSKKTDLDEDEPLVKKTDSAKRRRGICHVSKCFHEEPGKRLNLSNDNENI